MGGILRNFQQFCRIPLGAMVLLPLGFYEILPVFLNRFSYCTFTVVLSIQQNSSIREIGFQSNKFLIHWANKNHFRSVMQRRFEKNLVGKKIGTFLGEWQPWSLILRKSQGNVSEIGLQEERFPWVFLIFSEQLFYKIHANISSDI